ncbi:MAG: class I mannose-6-phosphate isomerase, partial [Anaerolineae bacterium]|nr:class I mannose-6-phosphate isomerase [Anaerolineae bacterium]
MTRPEIYPLTFAPVFRDYIWGGRNLETLFGRELPPGIIAESWEISGHPSSPTRVEYGHWAGRTLPQVMEALGEELVGRRAKGALQRGRFPLLIKLLDANRDLSVQVHPGDVYAQVHENGELGKTEMWYVLHAQPGTELIYGLARGVTPESFRRAIREGAVASQLQRVPIAAGDSFCVPAGTVHALLAGAVVAEIQQNSDATYRVYDWDRLGADGTPRPLHVRNALEVIDWDQVEPTKVRPICVSDAHGVRREVLV